MPKDINIWLNSVLAESLETFNGTALLPMGLLGFVGVCSYLLAELNRNNSKENTKLDLPFVLEKLQTGRRPK